MIQVSRPPVPPSPRRPRRLGRLLVIAAVVAWVAVAQVLWANRHGPWVGIATIAVLEEEGVVFSPKAEAFVIHTPDGLLGLSARSPHLGERLLYCRSSRWFQSREHGEKFDGRGVYADGPAPRGMDGVTFRVQAGVVQVIPDAVSPGPPRGTPRADPAGPFCADDSGEDPPGFFAEP